MSSSLVPDVRERSLAMAVSAIREAEGWLASWCPHGGDSSRVADYQAAREAQELLSHARSILGLRSP